jgi:uncharacterized protein (DUF342 family)
MLFMNNSGSPKEGKFDLYYKEGFATLIVYPPEEGGLPVYPEDIRSRMKILGISSVRLQLLVKAIEEASTLPVRLVEWPEGVLLSSQIQITIQSDLMSAEAIITAPKPGGGELSLKEIYDEIKKVHINYGIEEAAIHRVLSDREYNRPFLIARGKEPEPGRESIIEYHFEINRIKPFLEMKYGRINLKELNFIQNCQRGDLLAELKPAEPPLDGFNIMGTRFPAESTGEPVQLKCGKNAHIENDKVFADIQGNIILNKSLIEVEEVVSVNNVDYETGNIDFDGSVDIKGTIADGFTVKASGDIQIGKCIGRAKVYSARDVILKAGINGDREGTIHCEGNLLTKFIESSNISCGGDLIAEEAVMNSQVDVVGNLILSGKRAELIGGLSIVGGYIHCKKIGNLYDAKTSLIMGIQPVLIEKLFKAQKNLEVRRKKLDKLDDQLIQLKSIHPPDKESAKKIFMGIKKLEEDIKETSTEISRELHKLQEMREELIPAGKSYILAEDRIFRGVKLSFGLQDHYVPDKGISSSVVYRKGKNILEVGYNKVNNELPEELC